MLDILESTKKYFLTGETPEIRPKGNVEVRLKSKGHLGQHVQCFKRQVVHTVRNPMHTKTPDYQ